MAVSTRPSNRPPAILHALFIASPSARLPPAPPASPHSNMLPEVAAHLLYRLGASLRRMARPHDQLGLHPVDVGAGIRDHTVVALLDRPVPLDRDDRVGRNRGRDGDLLQGPDELV